jgi:hypothetical protein
MRTTNAKSSCGAGSNDGDLPRVVLWAVLLLPVATCGCAGKPAPAPVPAAPSPAAGANLTELESRSFRELQQLTFGGENAEAYWAFDGKQLSLQARRPGQGCDGIYRLPVTTGEPHTLVPISSGAGATTCAHFFPSGEMLFASTHLAGQECPPRPDMSRGYVWALYDSYDIFKTRPGSPELHRLTDEKGYDAEGTVCGQDGSIIFTSTRDGDIELYRMDKDGGNVRRLTHAPGYDGGAFFNADCSKIVWRASRPRPGKELDDFRALLAQGLVRPSKLEIWIADADGGNPVQLTYLDAASFAPFFHPGGRFVIFSSNYGDPRAREFDLWVVGTDGTHLTRITDTPGFDGFPHFSPDGETLAFSSNRATAPGGRDTNVFVAKWRGRFPGCEGCDQKSGPAADAGRIMKDIAWLSDPAREGRGPGTQGLAEAGAYVEARLREAGVGPAGDDGGFRQPFQITTGVSIAPATEVTIGGRKVARDEMMIPGWADQGSVKGAMVMAGYGMVDPERSIDDYRGKNVKGRVVLARRFVPDDARFEDTEVKRRQGDLRRKAWLARERGARALVVVDWPAPPAGSDTWEMPREASLPMAEAPGSGTAGLPVVVVKRSAVEGAWKRLAAGGSVPVTLNVALSLETQAAFNVVGKIPAGTKKDPAAGPLFIGAHYDHLGMGGPNSLAPGNQAPHVGADDNASGTATVLEIARRLAERRQELSRDVIIALFSGEEWGLRGANHYVRAHEDLVKAGAAMVNLDMVGRLRDNRVDVLGIETAVEWKELVAAACDSERVQCRGDGGGYGPSDQAAFYPAGLPVLHFFTGNHPDYHKPSDTADKINAAGAAAVARVVTRLAVDVTGAERLTFRKVADPAPRGDMRSFNASLGSIPDYAGPPDGQKGVLLSGVRPESAADKAGILRGDILVRLGRFDITSVQDLMFALNELKPAETVTAVVMRAGTRREHSVTLQESRRPR